MNAKKTLITLLFIASWIFSICFSGICLARLKHTRGLYNQCGKQLYQAGRDYQELADRFGSISGEVSELRDLANSNVRTARDAIDLIEQLRVKVFEMESYCRDFDWDSYYNYWDSYFQNY